MDSDIQKTPTEPTPSVAAHRKSSDRAIGIGVLTVSDTRTLENDIGGGCIVEKSLAAGHRVIDRRIVSDDIERLRQALKEMLDQSEIEAVLATGGTGLAARDRTPEAFEPLYDALLPGYGELFRMLSYQEVGTACMLSRASCGRIGSKMVFTMPGSPSGVQLAMEKVILPEIAHLVYHAQSHRSIQS